MFESAAGFSPRVACGADAGSVALNNSRISRAPDTQYWFSLQASFLIESAEYALHNMPGSLETTLITAEAETAGSSHPYQGPNQKSIAVQVKSVEAMVEFLVQQGEKLSGQAYPAVAIKISFDALEDHGSSTTALTVRDLYSDHGLDSIALMAQYPASEKPEDFNRYAVAPQQSVVKQFNEMTRHGGYFLPDGSWRPVYWMIGADMMALYSITGDPQCRVSGPLVLPWSSDSQAQLKSFEATLNLNNKDLTWREPALDAKGQPKMENKVRCSSCQSSLLTCERLPYRCCVFHASFTNFLFVA